MQYLGKLCRPAKEARHFCSYFHLGSGYGGKSKVPVTLCQACEPRLAFHSGSYSVIGHNMYQTRKFTNMNCRDIQNGGSSANLRHVPTKSALYVSTRHKQTQSISNDLKQVKSKDYIELYLHKNIVFLRVLCRLAKISTLICAVGIPVCLGSAQMGAMPAHTATSLASVFTFYSLIFTGQSFLFSSRIIGKILISTDEKYLKISHLTLFGGRSDIYVTPSDIIRSSDPGKNLFEKNIHQVQFKNIPKKFLFLPQYGGIDTNYEALEFLLVGDDGDRQHEKKESMKKD